VALGRRLVERDPAVGALVLECTNMPPYAHALQHALGLPVFDIVTLIMMMHETVTRRPYVGYC
jgi:Asp/Glu/hydantoin racemase